MRRSFQYIFRTVLVLLFSAGMTAKAQDAGSPSFEAYEPDHLRDRERIPLSPGEPVQPRSQTTLKDSTSAKQPFHRNVYKPSPVVPKDQNKSKSSENDDSILSFNFLYYLIQKYKMQDILD